MICVEVSRCRGDIVPDNGDNLSDIEDEDAQYVVPKDVAKEKGSTSSARFDLPQSQMKNAKLAQASIR